MSKELKKITENVMGQIHEGRVKMKPKMYFAVGAFLAFVGLVFSFITSVFLFSLIQFSVRSHGPMKEIRFEQLMNSFSWWLPFFAVISLFAGIILLKKYDFSYKKKYVVIIFYFIFSALIASYFVDRMGLQDFLSRKKHTRGEMHEGSRAINNLSLPHEKQRR